MTSGGPCYDPAVPIYEYRCANGHTFELFQRMSDPAPEACEDCGAPVQKILNAPAIHYKGSGFYSTDYGRGGKKGGAKDARSDAGSSSGSEGGSAAKDGGSSSASSSGGEKSSAPAKSAAD